MPLLVVASIYISREDIHKVVTRIKSLIRPGTGSPIIYLIGVPDPKQVIQSVLLCEHFKHQTVESLGAIRAGPEPPPEPITVSLVIGSPENRNLRVTQLRQILRHDIQLGEPAAVKRRPWGNQLFPFSVGQFGLDTFLPTIRLVVRRPDRVPHEGDDVPRFVPA